MEICILIIDVGQYSYSQLNIKEIELEIKVYASMLNEK